MIDTITLTLSNVKSYPLTKLRFEQTSKEGQTVFEVNETDGVVTAHSRIRALLHHDSGNIIPLTKRNAMYIPSSSYSLSYKYNIAADSIIFEFSIPKYLYGANILQFIKYFSQDSETMYNYLMGFIKVFIQKISFEPVDLRDVSITRLDLCYNQYFGSKFDALKYLDGQKQLLGKFARSSLNGAVNYDTSLTYKTKRYSFKIYHKGTEFARHDKRKLASNNPTGIDIPKLQDISDRILRYEVTFRKAQIDYLFREKQLYSKYVKFFFNESARRSFRALQPRLYRDILNFCERGHTYVMASVQQADAIRTTEVLFDKEVFNELYEFFWNYVKKFQLQCRVSLFDMVKEIDLKNEERDMVGDKKLRKKMSFNKPMLVMIAHYLQSHTLEDLRKSNLLSRSTFFVYQSKLKKLGVVSEGKLIDIPAPSLDYLDYLSEFGRFHIR